MHVDYKEAYLYIFNELTSSIRRLEALAQKLGGDARREIEKEFLLLRLVQSNAEYIIIK